MQVKQFVILENIVKARYLLTSGILAFPAERVLPGMKRFKFLGFLEAFFGSGKTARRLVDEEATIE